MCFCYANGIKIDLEASRALSLPKGTNEEYEGQVVVRVTVGGTSYGFGFNLLPSMVFLVTSFSAT